MVPATLHVRVEVPGGAIDAGTYRDTRSRPALCACSSPTPACSASCAAVRCTTALGLHGAHLAVAEIRLGGDLRRREHHADACRSRCGCARFACWRAGARSPRPPAMRAHAPLQRDGGAAVEARQRVDGAQVLHRGRPAGGERGEWQLVGHEGHRPEGALPFAVRAHAARSTHQAQPLEADVIGRGQSVPPGDRG